MSTARHPGISPASTRSMRATSRKIRRRASLSACRNGLARSTSRSIASRWSRRRRWWIARLELDFAESLRRFLRRRFLHGDRRMNRSTHRQTNWARLLLTATLLLLPCSGRAEEAKPAHPLDALTGPELTRVKAILTAEGKIGPRARFHSVDLDDPEKAAVLAWRPGTTLPRRAIAVVSEAGTVHEAAIDLSAGRMTGWRQVTGEPALLLGE